MEGAELRIAQEVEGSGSLTEVARRLRLMAARLDVMIAKGAHIDHPVTDGVVVYETEGPGSGEGASKG